MPTPGWNWSFIQEVKAAYNIMNRFPIPTNLLTTPALEKTTQAEKKQPH
jgi:hypothetical protein